MTSSSLCHHTVPWGFYIRIYITCVILGLLSLFLSGFIVLGHAKSEDSPSSLFSAWFYEMLYLLDLFVSAGSRAWLSAHILKKCASCSMSSSQRTFYCPYFRTAMFILLSFTCILRIFLFSKQCNLMFLFICILWRHRLGKISEFFYIWRQKLRSNYVF